MIIVSKAEAKILDSLALNTWTSRYILPSRSSVMTVRTLIDKKLLDAVKISYAGILTDADVANGSARVNVEIYSFPKHVHPSHVKKLSNDYIQRDDLENKIAELEEKVKRLQGNNNGN